MAPEAQALARHNLIEAIREFARWQSGGQALDQDGVLLATGARPFPLGFTNCAVRWDRGVPAHDAIDGAEGWFSSLGRGYTIFVLDDDDADLEGALRSRGLALAGRSPCMVCEKPLRERRLPSDVELRIASEETVIRDSGAVNADAYEDAGFPAAETEALYQAPRRLLRPGLRVVVAYGGGDALATATSVHSEGAAGIYWVATRRGSRRRGLAEACTARVANLGFQSGAALAILQATPMGEPVYRGLGFRQIGTVRWYLRPPAAVMP